MKAMEELLLIDCILGRMDFMGQLKWMKSSSSTDALMRQKLKYSVKIVHENFDLCPKEEFIVEYFNIFILNWQLKFMEM